MSSELPGFRFFDRGYCLTVFRGSFAIASFFSFFSQDLADTAIVSAFESRYNGRNSERGGSQLCQFV